MKTLSSISKLINAVQASEVSRQTAMMQVAASAKERVMRARNRFDTWVVATLFGAVSASASAQATTPEFSAVQNFLQGFVTFIGGPFGKAVVILSIVAAFCTWVFAPKDGIFGPILRVVVAGIAIMNAGLWIAQLGAASNLSIG